MDEAKQRVDDEALDAVMCRLLNTSSIAALVASMPEIEPARFEPLAFAKALTTLRDTPYPDSLTHNP